MLFRSGELDCVKGVGLIERKRRGLGKPNVIYVKNFIQKPHAPGWDPSLDFPAGAALSGREMTTGKTVMPPGMPGQPGDIKSQIQNCENHKSGNVKITNPELRKSQTNNTDLNNTEVSETDPSINPWRAKKPEMETSSGLTGATRGTAWKDGARQWKENGRQGREDRGKKCNRTDG